MAKVFNDELNAKCILILHLLNKLLTYLQKIFVSLFVILEGNIV